MAGAIRIERELPVAVRDGTVLRAELWRPDDDGRHPAILMRTPYVKETTVPAPILDARAATARGYAVVVQDVRGTGTSEGSFDPFVHEEADGADTVAWIAAQPWCDGRVVMAGMSYVGATQWLTAAARPPALRAIAPTLSSDEFGEGWSLRSGVVEHGFLGTWSAAGLGPLETRWYDEPERAYDDLDGLAAIAPWTPAWFAEPADSDYWRARSVAARRDAIDVPVLAVGGWYDLFLAATLRSFGRSRHPADRLVIGPWGHDAQLSHLVGDANAGIAGFGWPWFFESLLDFYDAALDGRQPDGPRVRAYVLGGRRWLDLPNWPPPGARALELALEPGAVAVRPDDPVPALGGRALLVGVPGRGDGVRDQRPLVGRDDVHVALRAPLPGARTLAGPVRARLAAEADAGALWTVTLCLEQADGALHNLCEGVARAGGGEHAVVVELGDVCVDVADGQALVVLVAGSSFPRWPRPPAAGTQRIGAGSALELTVAP
jgi:predicted acyl esterase